MPNYCTVCDKHVQFSEKDEHAIEEHDGKAGFCFTGP